MTLLEAFQANISFLSAGATNGVIVPYRIQDLNGNNTEWGYATYGISGSTYTLTRASGTPSGIGVPGVLGGTNGAGSLVNFSNGTQIVTLVGLQEFIVNLNPQSANTLLAGPASGSAANPTWRDLVAADMAALLAAANTWTGQQIFQSNSTQPTIFREIGDSGTSDVDVWNDGYNLNILATRSQGRVKLLTEGSSYPQFWVGNNGGEDQVYNPAASQLFGFYASGQSGRGYQLSSNGGIADWGLTSVAPGLAQVTSGIQTAGSFSPGQLQNTGCRARLGTTQTNASASMQNLPFYTVSTTPINLSASTHYNGFMLAWVSNTVAAEGINVDLNGGTATFTSIDFTVVAILGGTVATRDSTAAATALAISALPDTGTVLLLIAINLYVNAAGTFVPRFCENTHSSGTVSMLAGSEIWLEPVG